MTDDAALPDLSADVPPDAPQADPFLLDAEQLTRFASEGVLRRGVAYFREHRVTDVSWDETHVHAIVHGSRPFEPYEVVIRVDDGELDVGCTCPFDLEPACKHAVAALLAYGARQPVAEMQVRGAADAAVEERATRARGEVQVRHVAGDAWFGAWDAWSLDPRAGAGHRYRVGIRSVGERVNHCTCPDFATNRLGTCKHVEAVLLRLRKRGPKRFVELAEKGPPVPVVHLAWDVPGAPRIRLAGPREPSIAGYFSAEGLLRGELPSAWHAAREAIGAVATVGEDVEAHVRRLADDAAATVRSARIRDEIRQAGGHLPGVLARLYPYQVEGVAFLASAGRALLADDMGLGKTLQAIAAASWMMARDEVRHVLVVCPASLKHQWAREIRKFTGREAVVVSGGPESRGALYRQGAAFTIVNYELLLRDRDVVQRTLAPDLLVLDEAQRIKNWRTRIATCIKALSTTYAFVLTGTPLENRLEDLYSLLQVVDPRVLGPLWRYLLEFHVTEPSGKVIGYRNLGELRRRLAPVMLRRDRSLVRDQLPDRIETRLDIPLDSRQRALHDEAVDTAGRIALVAQRRPLTPEEEQRLMQALQRARMACDAAGLVDKETVGSPKLEELSRLLEELCVDGGRKVVVFSQWERMTVMAEQVAHALGLGTVRLHGGVPSHKRGALVDRFHEDPAVQVFISTDAGGTGLNLQVATALVNLDVPWNPAILEQRIARIHRLGQREPVQIVHLVAAEAYEARVAELVKGKRVLFDNVVNEDATEEVVGMSRKSVEAALASLEEARGADASASIDRVEVVEAPVDEVVPVVAEAVVAESAVTEAVATAVATAPILDTHVVVENVSAPSVVDPMDAVVAALDAAFGARIERVLAAKGGLVVVLHVVEPGDAARAEELARGVTVAVLDSATAAALARMGGGMPVPDARPVLVREPVKVVDVAARKLDAAQALLAADQVDEALVLMGSAVLAGAARAGGVATIRPEEAAVWLYGTALPRGWIGHEDAALVLRAQALAGAQSVPGEMAAGLLREARAFLGRSPAAPVA
ncbi:MAG: SNF2-related protein [Myxococcota bacterium]